MTSSHSHSIENLPFSGDIELLDFLLDFDDDNLDTKINQLIGEDSNILQQIETLSQSLNWHEKLALNIHAVAAIDLTHRQLCEVKPKHGAYNPNLVAAIALLQHLSLNGKTSLVCKFLKGDWDLGPISDSLTILIE